MKTLSVLALASLALSNLSYAADFITIGPAAVGGTGCVGGTATATLSPDGASLQIFYQEFVAEAVGEKKMDRKACSVAIPIGIPEGLSVAISDVEVRGFNLLPKKATATVQAEYFFAGSTGTKLKQNFKGPLMSDYLLKASSQRDTFSECGTDAILRVNTSALVKTNKKGEQALSIVDKAELGKGLVFGLKIKQCR